MLSILTILLDKCLEKSFEDDEDSDDHFYTLSSFSKAVLLGLILLGFIDLHRREFFFRKVFFFGRKTIYFVSFEFFSFKRCNFNRLCHFRRKCGTEAISITRYG